MVWNWFLHGRLLCSVSSLRKLTPYTFLTCLQRFKILSCLLDLDEVGEENIPYASFR